MNRPRIALLRVALLASDLVVLVVAFIVASQLRFGQAWWTHWQGVLPAPALVVPLSAIAVVVIFWCYGLYALQARWSFRREMRDLGRAGVTVIAVTLGVLFLFKLDNVSRLFLLAFFPLAALGTAGARAGIRAVFKRAHQRGRGLRRVLIVGSGPRAEHYAENIARPHVGSRAVGYLADDDVPLPGAERLGSIADLPRVLAREIVDEVAICLPMTAWAQIDASVLTAEEQGKTVRIPVFLTERSLSHGRLETVAGVPTVTVAHGPDHVLALGVKRLLDVSVAGIMLLLAVPVLAAAALAIVVTDGRPVLFTQRRTGLHGRHFHAYKLRTMVRDAEALRADLADRNERNGPVFKIAEDPRVTSVGSFLRRTSIDELPQLWNVLKGEMSLVGPRPALLEEVELYDPWHRRRLSVKPGLTGLWQISARNDPDFENWVALDLAYIDSWSLQQDIKLLLRTPLALLRDSGS